MRQDKCKATHRLSVFLFLRFGFSFTRHHGVIETVAADHSLALVESPGVGVRHLGENAIMRLSELGGQLCGAVAEDNGG